MFGIDSPEILVIVVVALIVVGPKELPGLLRGWGKWMAKARGMASEFRGHVDEMVRQSELDEVKKQIVDSTAGIDLQALDPTREIKSALNEGIAEGEKALAENKAQLDAIFARFAGRGEPTDPRVFGSIIRAMMNLRAAAKLRLRGRDTTPEQIQAIVDALDEAAKKIERV